MNFHRALFFCITLAASAQRAVLATELPAVRGPVSPQESLQHFVIADELRIELVAHEPAVIDPVAIRFDEDGRLWVVEMRDYPTAVDGGPSSRISILEDRDGDGYFESAAVFADGLSYATGLQPWRGGAVVTMAGRVAYLKDTDHDGRADLEETWFSGFAESNTQLRANHPRLGLDNHIYIANGLRGGRIVDARDPDAEPLSISGRDFRFDPITSQCEAVSGCGQFGLTFDDYGNRFVCSNRNPAMHVVLEDRHLKRNPLVAVPTVIHDMAKSAEASRVFPIIRAWTTSNLHAGQFTAACGLDIYRGDALPDQFRGNLFVCEPTGHLIHREIVHPYGVTFNSQSAADGVEFLASRDPWFSPVNLELGPDGALYVVDMYRAVIEHPEWMPEELRQRPDLLDGNDCGRIYRIVAKNHLRSAAVKLSNKSSAALTELLAHPNAWFRETAARLLVERQDNSVREQLEDLTQSSAGHLARIHALWTLAGLGAVDEGLLLRLLEDDDARVVEHAILASEPKVPSSSQLERRIASLATHGDARVRYLALLVASPQPIPPTSAVDAWEETAMLIAAGTRGAPFLTQLLSTEGWEKHIADPHQYVAKVARLAALSQEGRLQTVIEALLANDTYRRNGLTAYLTEVVRRGTTIDEVQAALTADTRLALRDELEAARRNALDAKLPVATRCDAIDLLSLTADAAETLLPIALDEPHPEVRRRAIVALSKHSDLATWNKLIDAFSDATPAIQSSIVDGMLASEPRTSLLLEAIADGRINAGQLDANRTNQLVSHPDSRINARARQVLDDAVPQDRQRVLAEYQPVLTMAANASSGKKIFARQCATCHRIGDVGVDVGPDISDSRLKTPAQLLTDILQPNRAIDSSFFCVTAVTADGVVHTGVLTSETTTSITLRQAEGKVITLARDEIERIASDGVSLMPDGLERLISPQDMADLVSFIKNWRYLDDSEIKPSPALTSEVQRGNASPPVSAD